VITCADRILDARVAAAAQIARNANDAPLAMASNPPYALRLTFAYRDAQIRFVGSERVAMLAPAPTGAPPEAGQTGYWIGLRDASGRIVYHRPLVHPVAVDAEVFSPNARESIARVPTTTREGGFTVLVPDDASAAALELHGPADPRRPDEPARELLRVDIDTARKMPLPPAGGGAPPRRGG
jgi:hypothetical protein